MSKTVTVGDFSDAARTLGSRFEGIDVKVTRLVDEVTMQYVVGGLRARVLTLTADGRLTRGTGDSWAEACGLSEDAAKRARQVTSRALAVLAAYVADAAADGVTVDYMGCEASDVDALISCILDGKPSLSAQYAALKPSGATRGPKGAVELLATAARQAVAEGMDEAAFLAAAKAAFAAASSAE